MLAAHLLLLLVASGPSSQSRLTRAETTPGGVFYRERTAPAAASFALVANPNPSPMGLRWTYANPPALPWIAESVSVGDTGAFAWFARNLNAEGLSFVSTTDDAGSPPLPIYEDPLLGADFVTARAAADGPACAVAVIEPAGSGIPHALRYYSGFAASPLFAASGIFPNPFEIAISDDGRYVAAGYTVGGNAAQAAVFDAASPTPAVPVVLLNASSAAFRQLDISGDGGTVLLASDIADHVFDRASGAQVFADFSTVSHDAHSIDFDGGVFARGGFDLRAWIRTGATYVPVLTFNDPSLGFPVYTACDVSADGSTFVAAAYDALNNSLFRVYCFQVALAGSTLLWTYANNGSGGLQDVPSAVSVSDDGRWIGVGSWGAQFNPHPEALLFDRIAGNVPVGSVDTPGSVFDLDLSPDGQFLVLGTKAVHANVLGNGGEAYSFDRGGQGHRVVGTPSVGRTITLRAGGAPGDVVLLLLGAALAAPIPIPGLAGTLDLDLAQLFLPPLLVGVVPPAGIQSLPVAIPNDPALVAAVVYSQTVRIGGASAFDNHLKLPVTP
ncbi:MAG TPA: hypothetical protein VFI25_09340 [Planctomycetota bacterium]|nr:hypothetical protein [Planctomycetota bacterium]